MPMGDFMMNLIKENPGRRIESWQGVRAEESPNRAKLPERDEVAEGWHVYRPVLKWTWKQVFAQHKKHDVDANPLYKLGMGRVGCMPCINVNKGELYEISRRFPKEIKRIREWEKIVSGACKRGMGTFFVTRAPAEPKTIDHFIEWSKTVLGGTQYDLLRAADDEEEPAMCASSYGLCE